MVAVRFVPPNAAMCSLRMGIYSEICLVGEVFVVKIRGNLCKGEPLVT